MVGIRKGIDSDRRGMSIEDEAACYYSKGIFLIGKEINAHFETVIIVAKLKPCCDVRITCQTTIIFKKFPFNIQSTAAIINVRVVIPKEIELVLPIIKIDTVL